MGAQKSYTFNREAMTCYSSEVVVHRFNLGAGHIHKAVCELTACPKQRCACTNFFAENPWDFYRYPSEGIYNNDDSCALRRTRGVAKVVCFVTLR